MNNKQESFKINSVTDSSESCEIKKDIFNLLYEYSKQPEPFSAGTGNIWTEPYLASQMLKSHLNENVDAASRKKETIEQTISYLSNLIAAGSSVLDLGCGPGLYAERLARLGFQVTGVDFSENSINYARANAEKEGLRITYRQMDFQNLDYCEAFDSVIQIYGEMNTFSDYQRDGIFHGILKALKPGGLFIFDITNKEAHKGNDKKTSWYASKGGFFRPGKHLVLESTVPYPNDVWLEQYIVMDESQTVVYRNWFHEYTPDSIENVLLQAGFSKVRVFENLYGVQQDKEWLTVIAEK